MTCRIAKVANTATTAATGIARGELDFTLTARGASHAAAEVDNRKTPVTFP
jgi:hypothetical protein